MANLSGTEMQISKVIFKHGTKVQLETSSYLPDLGEIVVATDVPLIKLGDGVKTLAQLDFIGGSSAIEDSYTSTATDKGLSAAKGKDLNDRIEAFRNITTIDCGELPVEETDDPEQQSGE